MTATVSQLSHAHFVMTKARAIPNVESLDAENLRILVLAQHAELEARDSQLVDRDNQIENLKLWILKLKRMTFGASSEKRHLEIEQLELELEDLETDKGAANVEAPSAAVSAARHSGRRPLPAELPRETETLKPEIEACPDCGEKMGLLGEDVAEMLEYVPARFKVIRIVRPKLSCTRCDRIVQQPAPHRPIDRGLAGPGFRLARNYRSARQGWNG